MFQSTHHIIFALLLSILPYFEISSSIFYRRPGYIETILKQFNREDMRESISLVRKKPVLVICKVSRLVRGWPKNKRYETI